MNSPVCKSLSTSAQTLGVTSGPEEVSSCPGCQKIQIDCRCAYEQLSTWSTHGWAERVGKLSRSQPSPGKSRCRRACLGGQEYQEDRDGSTTSPKYRQQVLGSSLYITSASSKSHSRRSETILVLAKRKKRTKKRRKERNKLLQRG